MKTVALFSLALVIASLASAKPPADLQHRLDQWIKGQSGGAAVAWVDADGTAFFQSGRFDGEGSPAITADTQFELGSITKVFTSLLLAESERLGKVSRADPAAKYLLPATDPAQPALADITLLSLATHTSGLPRLSSNIGPNPDANPDPYAKYDHAMLVEALRKDGAVATVGRGVAYSNFGGAVLGEALGAAWGTSYAEALRLHVLEPLGMKATTLGLAGSPPPPDFSPGHSNGKTVPNWTFQAYAPAGALRSSARDMAHFLEACLRQGNEASPLGAAIKATIQPQYPTNDLVGHIGLAWFITDEGVIWHNGATAGSHAFVAFNPKSGAAVAILANVQLSSEPLGFGLLGAKLPKPRVEIAENATDYVGRYPLSPAFAIDVTENRGSLHVQATGQPAFGLRVVGADRFALVGVPAEISFERDAVGKVIAAVLHQNGRDQRAPRNELPPPPKEVALPVETLREYVGEYPLSPQFVLTITETDGALFAQATGQGKAQLFASGKDEFFYKIVNAQVSFERDTAGKVTGLVLHQNGRTMPAHKTK
ncbi:MAG TPA: serine hydrolase [Opitutaceae bacterium]|nr:serine hydrolase [Opitutaceae bacterium]